MNTNHLGRMTAMVMDCVCLFRNTLEIGARRIIQVITFKPVFAYYIEERLKKRFDIQHVSVINKGRQFDFYLEIPGGFTKKDQLNTAKMFGLGLKYVQFRNIHGFKWKITFLPDGVQKVRSLINTFPNWWQQFHTGKTVSDFEPKEVIYLTHEQKLKQRKEGKKTWSVIIDILDYLFSIPILRNVLRQIYRYRGKLNKIIDKIPENKDDIKILPYIIAGVAIICLFIYTFVFWASLFCLLLAGYAIRRIKRSLQVKIIM